MNGDPNPAPLRTNLFKRMSPFEGTVLWVVIGLLVVLLLVIAIGDRVGVRAVAQSPGPGTVAVPVNTSIAIKFDTRLAAGQSPDGLLQVEGVPGSVEVRVDELHFTPAGVLAPNAWYTVTVVAGVLGENGRALLRPVTWSFLTGATSIAYTHVDPNGYEQLFRLLLADPIADTDPSTAGTQLSQASLGIWDFAVAPEGNRIVYSVLTEEGGADLWSVVPGAEPSLLYACPRAACSTPAYAPQGNLIAFSKRNVTDYAAAMVSPPRLWLFDMVTGEAAPVFDDSQRLAFDPRWSGDGQWLSYISPDQVGIGTINLSTGATSFFPTSTGEAGVWHPSRPLFAMSTVEQVGDQFVTHLQLVDVEGGSVTDLSGEAYAVEDNSPAWSPDGQWIAFRRKEFSGERASPGKQIWIMRGDGSDARPLTQEPGYDHGTPVWSPDGAMLTYHRFPLRGPEIVIEVMAQDVSSGEMWVVARPGQRPQWIP